MTERGLVRRATPLLLGALSFCPERCRVTHELPIGHSIADVVILRTLRGHDGPEAPLTVAESVILSTLRRLGASRPDTIGRHVFMPADDVRELLEGRLASWRLVRSRTRGLIEARAAWVQAAEVIAIEAKLTRWRDALEQATQYRRYADRAFVLLPEASAGIAARDARAFRAAGVGLLSYDARAVSCLIPGAKSKVHSWHREYALSRV